MKVLSKNTILEIVNNPCRLKEFAIQGEKVIISKKAMLGLKDIDAFLESIKNQGHFVEVIAEKNGKTKIEGADSIDSEILRFCKKYSDEEKVLILYNESKLEYMAKELGIKVQNLKKRSIYKGYVKISLSGEEIDQFIKAGRVKTNENFHENQFLLLNEFKAAIYKNGWIESLVHGSQRYKLDDEYSKMYDSALFASAQDAPLVIATGVAGTGKTYMAITAAIEQAVKDSKYGKVIVVAPTITIGGEEIGALPGDAEKKVSPFLGGVQDAIFNGIAIEKAKKMPIAQAFKEAKQESNTFLEEGTVEILPIGFLVGHSFENCFIIADEMQNASFLMLKSLVTRVGKNSKLVITGDPDQTQLEEGESLSKLTQIWKDEPLCWQVHLSAKRNRRSKLVEVATRIM